jgi:hypothetical protein
MPWSRVLATTVSMLLYLCSEGPDVRRVALPQGQAPIAPQRTVHGPYKSAGVPAQPQGSPALSQRDARRRDRAPRRPHLREPHHYWTGPVSDPVQRQLVLRYLAPISVGSELPVTTVVRPAS